MPDENVHEHPMRILPPPALGISPVGPNKTKECPGQDSNLHTLRQRLLRPSCLPFHHPGEGNAT